MNDHELKALSAFVLAEALCRHADDQGRISNGQSVGYGDMTFPEKDALQGELKSRASAHSSQFDPPWTGHGRVELMGHRSYLGRIREVDRYGSRMGEVQELLPSGEYGETHVFGGKSVYEIQTLSLDAALAEVRPVKLCYCGTCGRSSRQVPWGDPNYDACADEICERCKAKDSPATQPSPAGDDLPFEKCEECANRATHHDAAGIPFCDSCDEGASDQAETGV